MDRRHFIKSTSLLTLPLILKSCDWLIDSGNYAINVQNDANVGHLIYESKGFRNGKTIETETLIVGGGIAGLSAACQLKNSNFLLCELSDRLGGSSSSDNFQGINFSQGAHYDLAYPANYGPEVLSFLNELDLLHYQDWNDSWSFNDREHIILHRSKNQCFDHGSFRKDVLKEGPIKDQFLSLIAKYKNRMQLPSRLISEDLRSLDKVDFLSFLQKEITLDQEFVNQLDYHMKDDYGVGAAAVSALAGIHYFMCRPYYDEIVELFSPPEGNNYFIRKMAAHLPSENLKTNHLVKSIKENPEGFEVSIVDVMQQQNITVNCKKLIYAGQKHALKYIWPEKEKLFAHNDYAPWMVVNVVVKDELPSPAFWQNEMLTNDSTFMGFVDSGSQHREDQKMRVLTGYYCLPIESRQDLLTVEKNKKVISQKTINHISEYFQQDISKHVEQVNIKVMGHAMPIPKPGYLFDDKNQYRDSNKFAFAGVDNSRLPLFYEAVDSGIQAAIIVQ